MFRRKHNGRDSAPGKRDFPRAQHVQQSSHGEQSGDKQKASEQVRGRSRLRKQDDKRERHRQSDRGREQGHARPSQILVSPLCIHLPEDVLRKRRLFRMQHQAAALGEQPQDHDVALAASGRRLYVATCIVESHASVVAGQRNDRRRDGLRLDPTGPDEHRKSADGQSFGEFERLVATYAPCWSA